MLEGESTVIEVDGGRLGIAGAKGFGGGFAGACAADFGEAEMKRFVRHTKESAGRLGDALDALDVDCRVALPHYSPVEATLRGERPEIFPFLGSYLLAEAVDRAGPGTSAWWGCRCPCSTPPTSRSRCCSRAPPCSWSSSACWPCCGPSASGSTGAGSAWRSAGSPSAAGFLATLDALGVTPAAAAPPQPALRRA